MSNGDSVGQIHQMSDDVTVEWKIVNFKSMMSKEPGTYYYSPVFVFSDMLCFLKMFPNGETEIPSEGYLGLYFYLKKKQEHNIFCSLSFKNSNGGLEYRMADSFIFKDAYGWGWDHFCKTSDIVRRKYELLPDGILTIHCRLKREDTRLVGITQFQRLLNLCKDLKKMLTEQENTDVVFKFQEREIRAHRMILKSRSEYFETMFENDMVENRTGIVAIDDIEPDVFQLVLSYIYCGEVEELSTDNMCRLYLAADKYQLTDLKKMCATFMEENTSEDLFCDVLVIADTYEQTELMQFCKKFFMLNSKRIMKTEMWKNFHKENMKVAFQLLHSIFEEIDLKS